MYRPEQHERRYVHRSDSGCQRNPPEAPIHGDLFDRGGSPCGGRRGRGGAWNSRVVPGIRFLYCGKKGSFPQLPEIPLELNHMNSVAPFVDDPYFWENCSAIELSPASGTTALEIYRFTWLPAFLHEHLS
jgi:hypothetical protein